jgi:tripeptidyl-peptidase I
MNPSLLVLLLILLYVVLILGLPNHEPHVEVERMSMRNDFREIGKWVNKNTDHEVVVAIKPQNLDTLSELVHEMSTPGSLNYQQWMTYDEVGALTTNMEGYRSVQAWLEANGMNITYTSKRFEYLKATAPLVKWEEVLNTEFYEFRSQSQSRPLHGHPHMEASPSPHAFSDSPKAVASVPRARAYSVPARLRGHIHALFNVCHLPPAVRQFGRLERIYRSDSGSDPYTADPKSEMTDSRAAADSHHRRTTSTGDSTVQFLRDLYNISVFPDAGLTNVSQSVFQTSREGFDASDLAAFQLHFGLDKRQPIVVDETGRNVVAGIECSIAAENCIEGNLDTQYMMGLAPNTTTYFWYVGGSAQDVFVDYALAIADAENPPSVNSISWGAHEQAMQPTTMDSFNLAALQLAAMGVSVLVASGDDGVSNFLCSCNEDSSSYFSLWSGEVSWQGQGYFPSFPATSPYVTAVGGTMGPNNGVGEVACASEGGGVITTGGGFSTYYSAPAWQSDALSAFFADSTQPPPAAGFNHNGRGYPDVSLIATRYPVMLEGALYNLYGTSASSPALGAFLSQINAKRELNGLPTVGWINPTLYSHGSLARTDANVQSQFNDITEGGNHCCSGSSSSATCCAAGFESVPGWDPVTGWGSIDYSALETLLGVEPGAVTPTPTTDATPATTPTQYPTPLPTQLGYFVSVFTRNKAACSHYEEYNDGFLPGATQTVQFHQLELGQQGLFQMEGNIVGRCIFVSGKEGAPGYWVMNVLNRRNIFMYLRQYRFDEDNRCSGIREPTLSIALSTGYASCMDIGDGLYTVSMLLLTVTPWDDPTLPAAVMRWEYIDATACDTDDFGIASFFWMATGVCQGLSRFECDANSVVGPASVNNDAYVRTDYSLQSYLEPDCSGNPSESYHYAFSCVSIPPSSGGNDPTYYYYDEEEALLADTVMSSTYCRMKKPVDAEKDSSSLVLILGAVGGGVALVMIGFYVGHVRAKSAIISPVVAV